VYTLMVCNSYVTTGVPFPAMVWSGLRRPYAVCLGVVLGAGGVAGLALTMGAASGITLVVGAGICGQTGSVNGTSCSYVTVGSDTFTVPVGVASVVVDVVGAQGGRYFVAGD